MHHNTLNAANAVNVILYKRSNAPYTKGYLMLSCNILYNQILINIETEIYHTVVICTIFIAQMTNLLN